MWIFGYFDNLVLRNCIYWTPKVLNNYYDMVLNSIIFLKITCKSMCRTTITHLKSVYIFRNALYITLRRSIPRHALVSFVVCHYGLKPWTHSRVWLSWCCCHCLPIPASRIADSVIAKKKQPCEWLSVCNEVCGWVFVMMGSVAVFQLGIITQMSRCQSGAVDPL